MQDGEKREASISSLTFPLAGGACRKADEEDGKNDSRGSGERQVPLRVETF